MCISPSSVHLTQRDANQSEFRRHRRDDVASASWFVELTDHFLESDDG